MVEDTLSKADPTKIVYPYDFATAKDRLEERFYHDSRKLNIDCAESIDAAIRDCCYASNHYNLRGAVRKVVSEYGFERVNRVVARLIQRNDYDGRYSTANKTWAADFAVPEAAFNGAIMNAHPVLLDDFAKYLREMYAELDGARFTLPGQPEFGEKVHDYEIIRSIRFDDNRGFAIGHNTDAVEKFVAWQFTTEKGERDFYWGNYSDSLEVAGQNYSVRVGNHLRDGDAEVIQNPVAAEQTTIRVRLISDEQRESDGAWLKLPATVDDLRAVFEQIGVHGPNGERYIAAEFSSPCKGVAEILSPNDSLDELNMLASYLKDMESWEIDKLQAILTGNVAVGVDSASGLINLLDADTFASFHVIDANTISELGAYWIRELPDDVPEGATAAEYGAQCASEDGGVFTEWGYAYKRYDTSVEYDGVVPQEYRIVDFALLDLPARVDRHEQTNSVKAQLEASRKVPPAPRKKKDDKDGHKSER
ncbi:MAG: DUF3849 domain-containing protein [Oscillospiraceae bacterium]|nr:DUF3849 domain-containing protein [Oscillospiraceae bacterium]